MITDDMIFQPGNIPESAPGVYLVENLMNGKKYIGISSNLKRRATEHARAKSGARLLEKAIKKYGHNSFLFVPICYALNGDTSSLPEIESKLISLYGSVRNGYNVQESSGAVGPYGDTFAMIIKTSLNKESAKKNMSEAQKKSKRTPEARAAQSERTREFAARPDVFLKKSNSMKKALSCPHVKAALIQRIKGMQTDEFVKNRVEKQKQTMSTPEFKAKRSAASKKMQTKELSEKKSASLRATMSTAEYKAKRSAASKKMQSDSLREKKRASLLATYADENVRKKVSESKRGRKWITNGVELKCIHPSEGIPEGWRLGRKLDPIG